MSLLDVIINFFKGLFGTKKTDDEVVNVEVNVVVPRMNKSVFSVMTSSESDETKNRLWNEMIEHEKNGEVYYTIRSNTWEYQVRNGQFIATPLYAKE